MAYAVYVDRELTLNAFKNGIFPIKKTFIKRLKILNSKQLPERLPIFLVKVKVGSTSENLLNEIRKIIYFL